MKSKYLLATYDELIQELKKSPKTERDKLIKAIAKENAASYLCYKISYLKTKSKTEFKANPPIHNLHPLAPVLEHTLQITNQDWEFAMETIKNQLNIPFSNLKYYNYPEKGTKYFYLTADVDLETLTDKHLLFLYLSITLKKENQEIIIGIKHKTFKFEFNKAFRQFLYKKQAAIESVKDRIIKEINPKTLAELFEISDENTGTDGFKAMFFYLEKLSRCIEKDYSKFLNPNATIAYRTLICDEHKNIPKINTIKAFLMKSNISLDLFKIITDPFYKIITPNIIEKTTVNEYRYLSKFIATTYTEILRKNKLFTQSDCDDWLLDYNFNTTEFLLYLQENTRQHIENVCDDAEKLDLLNLLIKKYIQQPTKIAQRLRSKLPNTKSKMLKWLQQERNYLLNKMVLVSGTTATTSEKEKIKLLTDFSVAQLACLLNITVQTDVIIHNNTRDVLRVFADNFKTRSTDKISLESLTNKFHTIEEATLIAVKKKLTQMINLTKSLLFLWTFLEDLVFIFD